MTPLIYTTKGNLPEADLKLVDLWEHHDSYTKLTVQRWLGDEVVRQDVHVYSKQGVVGCGELASF